MSRCCEESFLKKQELNLDHEEQLSHGVNGDGRGAADGGRTEKMREVQLTNTSMCAFGGLFSWVIKSVLELIESKIKRTKMNKEPQDFLVSSLPYQLDHTSHQVH